MTIYEFVEGWTAPIFINLLARGQTPAGDMAGMTAELVLKDKDGNQINTAGDVSIANANAWQIEYDPDPSDFVAGEYRGRFKVTDGAGKIAYFPSNSWDVWYIRKVTY